MIISSKRKLFILVWFLFVVFWNLKTNASEVEVFLQVDKTGLTIEDQLELQVVVKGTRDGVRISKLENIENFDVNEGGTSTQVSIINGSRSVEKVISYTLYPKKVGNFKIGPAKVTIDGKLYKSNIVNLTVSKEEARDLSQKQYFVEAIISNSNPYVNEQVVYTFSFYTRIQTANGNLSIPEFKGFWKENIGKQKQFQRRINGEVWNVNEFKLALFPTSSGTVKIPPTTLIADLLIRNKRRSAFGSFFEDEFFNSASRKRVRLKTKSFELNIKPLPKMGNFSGYVGKLQGVIDVSKKNLKVGDSATLTITLTGDGNIRDLNFPEVDWQKIKIYDDKPIEETFGSERLFGKKVIKKALVPTVEGTITIPSIKIPYFDPIKGEIEYLAFKQIDLVVKPGDEKQKYIAKGLPARDSFKKEVKLLGKDLMPIVRESDSFYNSEFSKVERIILIFLFVFSIIIFTICYFLRIRQIRIENDSGYLLRENAFKLFKSSFDRITFEDQVFFSKSGQVLRDYLANKLSLEGKGITSYDVSRVLSPFKIRKEVVESVEKLIKFFEMGLYAGKSIELSQKKDMKKELYRVIKIIEREVRK